MLIEAVVIVLAVSFISLGLHKRQSRLPLGALYIDMRPGLVVGITIPLVLAVTFLAMYYWGIGLHKISLGSLIIALGLLVDDAIIAVEMMVRKMEEGYDKVRAATFAYDVTAMPMLTGTLITAAGFLPIGMAKSTVGEYTFAIFAVTVMARWCSAGWCRCTSCPTSARCCCKAKPPRCRRRTTSFSTRRSTARFRRTVDWCVEHRWITIGATLLIFALGIVGMGKVQQQFFPDSSRPEIMVDIWFPEGTSFAANEETAKRCRGAPAAREPGVESGRPPGSAPACRASTCRWTRFSRRPTSSQLIVLPKDLTARESLRVKLPALLARPNSRRCAAASSCCPTGRRCLTRCSSASSAPTRRRCASAPTRSRQSCAQNPNTRGVNDNWNESVKVLRLEVDQAKARALGVTSQSIAQASRTILRGTTVGQYREDDKLIDIVLRQPLDERNAITGHRQRLPADGVGQVDPADADRQAGVHLGAGRDVAREPRLRDHGAGRHRRGPAGRRRVTQRSCCPQLEALRGEDAGRLPHRGGRRGGGKQQGLGLDRRRRADRCCSSCSPC